MSEPAGSDEADALYRPLAGVRPWAAACRAVAGAAPTPPPGDDPAWAAMVGQGVLLAAAHESAALAGLHAGDRGLARSLISGASSLSAVDRGARAHVLANYDALGLARAATDGELASAAWIRRVHGVACRSQLTHTVGAGHTAQDHVLAAGDYKHHPNHRRAPDGTWVAHAPVRRLGDEMGRFLAEVAGPGFEELGPVGRAAYVHHAVTHVAPFAAGNGRVARVLAGAHLLRAAGTPLLVFADEAPGYSGAVAEAGAGDPAALVAFVERQQRAVVDLLFELRATAGSTPGQVAALYRWRRRDGAAAALAALLPAAVEAALDRHRRRADLGWLSRLDDAVVTESPLTVRVASVAVDETLSLDAHPVLDDGALVLRAVQARLGLDVRPEDLLPRVAATVRPRLDPWLDRAVSCLALRVAAELE